jgi:hypothetical protein
MGVVEAVDDHSCQLHVGADSASALVRMITSVDTDFFTLTSGPPGLADAFRAQAARCLHAICRGRRSLTPLLGRQAAK